MQVESSEKNEKALSRLEVLSIEIVKDERREEEEEEREREREREKSFMPGK